MMVRTFPYTVDDNVCYYRCCDEFIDLFKQYMGHDICFVIPKRDHPYSVEYLSKLLRKDNYFVTRKGDDLYCVKQLEGHNILK